jgi:hypothetical protein
MRRGGRSYAQEEQETTLPQDRSAPARSGSGEIGCVEQLELALFPAKLQIRDGAIHHLVLF